MEWIAAMQQAITYMEEHLLEEINYEVVAKQVHTSGYEFHRAFSFLTGMTAMPISGTADCHWPAEKSWKPIRR